MITETFDVGTGLPGLGEFEVTFREGTSVELLGPYVAATLSLQKPGPTENWRHSLLVITDGRVTAPTRAGVLDRALFAGEALKFRFGEDNEQWSLWGRSFLNWLGDDDNKGPGVNTGTDYTSGAPYTGTFATYMLGLVVAGACNGIGLDATAASIDTGTFAGLEIRTREIARQRIEKLCAATDPRTEFYADPTDLTLYFQGYGDTTNAYFRADPLVLFGRGVPTSREASLTSYACRLAVEIDYSPVATGLRVENTAGSSTATSGSSDPIRNDITGTGTGSRGKFLGASDDLYSQHRDASLANLLAAKYSRSDTVTVTVGPDENPRRDVKPGDNVYVWAPLAGIEDETQVVIHDGRSMRPRAMRCSQIDWPVRDPYGVYLVHVETEYGGVNAVQDLTDHVVMEDGASTEVQLATASPMSLRKALRGSQYRTRWDDR